MSDLSDKTTAVEEPGEARLPASGVCLVLHHPEGAKVVPLREGTPVVVGRAYPADAVVSDLNVSRRHARFTWEEDGVWVEDLGSTNGTRLNGTRVERARVRVGDVVAMSTVRAGLQEVGPEGGAVHRAEGHDRFLARLEEEVTRARTFGRPVSLLMIRALDPGRAPALEWLPHLRRRLRPVDSVGLYGPGTVLVALPEVGLAAAAELATAAVTAPPLASAKVVAGVAEFPATAGRAAELVDVARRASRAATLDDPVGRAEAPEGFTPTSAVVAESEAMRRLFGVLGRVGRSAVPVLILGETGTGKEVVAGALHEASPRRGAPMRCVNCGALPTTLLESILFGHERGAFTGADRRAPGVFEQAIGGTVFLDEIGELSAAAQAALLRVLEAKRVTRLGATEEVEVDVRIVAATHRDLEAMCGEGAFRWDLYYRLNTVILEIPPLRERRDDIEPLANRFLAEARLANDSPVARVDPAALEVLLAYDWPGNVRELRNVIERAVVIAEADAITPAELPERVRSAAATGGAPAEGGARDGSGGEGELEFRDLVRNYEVALITEALQRAGGNQSEAARQLRIPLRTLTHKLRAYGIPR